MSDKNTSTLQSYLDSATGAIQSGVAAITGSAGDRANAEQSHTKADAEHDLSHAAVKAGPYSVSSTGVPAKDNSDRTEGSWNQTVGSLKEGLGGLVGSEDLKNAGRQQNLEGQEQEAKGQLSDLGKGVSDRIGGAVGGAYANLTGNKAAEEAYRDQHVSNYFSQQSSITNVTRTRASLDNGVLKLTCRKRLKPSRSESSEDRTDQST